LMVKRLNGYTGMELWRYGVMWLCYIYRCNLLTPSLQGKVALRLRRRKGPAVAFIAAALLAAGMTPSVPVLFQGPVHLPLGEGFFHVPNMIGGRSIGTSPIKGRWPARLVRAGFALAKSEGSLQEVLYGAGSEFGSRNLSPPLLGRGLGGGPCRLWLQGYTVMELSSYGVMSYGVMG